MPLEPTPSQVRFFEAMEHHGKEGADLSAEKQSLFFIVIRLKEAKRQFFSLFHGKPTDGEDEPTAEGNSLSVDGDSLFHFTMSVEEHGLDDFRAVRGIQELVRRSGDGIGDDHLEAIQRLSHANVGNTFFQEKQSETSADDSAPGDLFSQLTSFSRKQDGTWEYKDMSGEIFQKTCELLRYLRAECVRLGSLMEEHGLIDSQSALLTQIDVCLDVLANVEVRQEGRTYRCALPAHISVPFSDVDRDMAIEEQTIHPYIERVAYSLFDRGIDFDAVKKDPVVCSGVARALFVQHLGLDGYLQYFQYLATLLEYAALSKQQDEPRYGEPPTFLASEDGLILDLKQLIHPQWATGKTFQTPHERAEYEHLFGESSWRRLFSQGSASDENDDEDENYEDDDDDEFGDEGDREESVDVESSYIVDPAQKELWDRLERDGHVERITNTGRFHSEAVVWKPGLSRNKLSLILERYQTSDEHTKGILKEYDTYGFNPFQQISLNSRERIQILTGANSNGKSTLMRSIGLALNAGMTGRKIQAVRSSMSFCDGVYHDFHLSDDVREGVSTFRAQVRNVLTFLHEATPDSLGLFDEMYHGTSSLYLLSLAWSTVEEMSRKNLRAIISTHEPLLTFATRGDGLDQLRGIYANQRNIVDGQSGGGIDGVSNISLRNHFELRKGAVMDSDALRIAEEEGMSEKIIARAHHIKTILMGEAS